MNTNIFLLWGCIALITWMHNPVSVSELALALTWASIIYEQCQTDTTTGKA